MTCHLDSSPVYIFATKPCQFVWLVYVGRGGRGEKAAMPCVQSHEARCLRLCMLRDSSEFTRHDQKQQPCLRCRTKWGVRDQQGQSTATSTWLLLMGNNSRKHDGKVKQSPNVSIKGGKTMEQYLGWSFSRYIPGKKSALPTHCQDI